MLYAAAFLIFAIPHPRTAFQHADVDKVELNRVYDERGDLELTQIICWRWDHFRKRYIVSEWFRVSGQEIVAESWRVRKRIVWRGSGGTVYEALTPTFLETDGFNDPELDDRAVRKPAFRIPYFQRGR